VHLTDHVSTKPEAQLQMRGFAALTSSAAFRLVMPSIRREPFVSRSMRCWAACSAGSRRITLAGRRPVEFVAVYQRCFQNESCRERPRAR
jgi:hypothetical protein